MGSVVLATAPSTVRRFALGDYVVDYQIEVERIVVLVIRHRRQNPPEVDTTEGAA
jgi:plasmid stabilization system protein ParE